MLSGDNSILSKAGQARDLTGQKQIEERVSLAYNAAVMEDINNGDGKLQQTTLSAELTKLFPGSTIDIDTTTDTTGKKWYVTIDGGTPIEVDAGKSTPQVADLPKDKGTTPYYPSDKFTKVKDTDLTTGLVITDSVDENGNSTGNEYVWIEVPNKKLDSSATFGPDYAGNSVSGSTDYGNIEKAMIAYVKDGLLNGSEDTSTNSDAFKNSRMGWKDEWYDGEGKMATGDNASSNLNDTTGCGLTSDKYTELYHKMLKSVYENGGFWIGRYEAGQDTGRSEAGDISSDLKPYSKFDKIPIMWVTCSQAQTIATRVENKGSYNSSLMFGIQWDCVLKYLQNKGVETSDLISNSSSWGNYSGVATTITRGRYWNFGDSYPTPLFKDAGTGHTRQTSGAPECFSTGAIPDSIAKKNIYDLAGNMYEWTLEHATSGSAYPCVPRGGSFDFTGSDYPASSRRDIVTSISGYFFGFRVSLY